MDLIKALNEKQLKEVPQVLVGDTVRVHVKVKEGARERIQVFEGTVIAKKHGGIEETITVRRLSYGVGVEKVFPVHSPSIEKIETVRHGYVRRAKLYYLRDRVGKAAKVREIEKAPTSVGAFCRLFPVCNRGKSMVYCCETQNAPQNRRGVCPVGCRRDTTIYRRRCAPCRSKD